MIPFLKSPPPNTKSISLSSVPRPSCIPVQHTAPKASVPYGDGEPQKVSEAERCLKKRHGLRRATQSTKIESLAVHRSTFAQDSTRTIPESYRSQAQEVKRIYQPDCW